VAGAEIVESLAAIGRSRENGMRPKKLVELRIASHAEDQ
jgi:hypothetical protein